MPDKKDNEKKIEIINTGDKGVEIGIGKVNIIEGTIEGLSINIKNTQEKRQVVSDRKTEEQAMMLLEETARDAEYFSKKKKEEK